MLAAILPAPVAAVLATRTAVVTDYEQRCFETLDVDTHPLVCSLGGDLLLSLFGFGVLHLLIALPVACYVAWALRPRARTAIWLLALVLATDLSAVGYYLALGALPVGGEAINVLAPIALCPILAVLLLRIGREGHTAQQGAAADAAPVQGGGSAW